MWWVIFYWNVDILHMILWDSGSYLTLLAFSNTAATGEGGVPPHCDRMELEIMIPIQPLLTPERGGFFLLVGQGGTSGLLWGFSWHHRGGDQVDSEIPNFLLGCVWYDPCGEEEGSLVTTAKSGGNSKLPSGVHWHCWRTSFLDSGDESPSSPCGFPGRGVRALHYCPARWTCRSSTGPWLQ